MQRPCRRPNRPGGFQTGKFERMNEGAAVANLPSFLPFSPFALHLDRAAFSVCLASPLPSPVDSMSLPAAAAAVNDRATVTQGFLSRSSRQSDRLDGMDGWQNWKRSRACSSRSTRGIDLKRLQNRIRVSACRQLNGYIVWLFSYNVAAIGPRIFRMESIRPSGMKGSTGPSNDAYTSYIKG